MTCEICDPGSKHQTGGFATEADFIAERRRIDSQISSGVFVVDTSEGFEVKYHCDSCGQRWHLSTPDWAYRGFLKRLTPSSMLAPRN
jgi:hypothetical protein